MSLLRDFFCVAVVGNGFDNETKQNTFPSLFSSCIRRWKYWRWTGLLGRWKRTPIGPTTTGSTSRIRLRVIDIVWRTSPVTGLFIITIAANINIIANTILTASQEWRTIKMSAITSSTSMVSDFFVLDSEVFQIRKSKWNEPFSHELKFSAYLLLRLHNRCLPASP